MVDNNLIEINDLMVVQQKTEEKQINVEKFDQFSEIAPPQVLSQVNNIQNKLLEMENQVDVLSVMDNESVFVETQMNAPNNIAKKAGMSEMRTE